MSKRSVPTKARPAQARRQPPPRNRPTVDLLDLRLAAAQRTVLGVVVVLAAVALYRSMPDPFVLPKLTAVVVGAVVLLALAGVRAVRAGRVTVPAGTPVWIAAAFAGALLLATVTADNVVLSLVGQHSRYAGLLSYLAYLAVFLVALRLYSTDAPRGLIKALFVAVGLVTAYGLLQVAGLDPYTWQARLDEPTFSTLGNTNFAAAYVAMGCPVLAAVAVLRGWSRGWRLAAVGLLVAGLLYVLATRATQGPLAAAGGLAVVGAAWALARRRAGGLQLPGSGPARLVPAVGALLAVVVLAGIALRLAPDAVGSFGERRQFWQAALAIFADHPILGTGLDSFRDYFTQYRPAAHAVERGFQATDSAHNLPLAMLAAGGLPLALSYLAFVGYTGWALVRGLRAATPDRLVALAGFGGMWAAYQVQSLVSLDVPPLTFLHFLSAAIIIATVSRPAAASFGLPIAPAARGAFLPGGRGRARRIGAVGLAVVLLVGASSAWLAVRPLRADLAAGGGFTSQAERVAALDKAVRLAPWEGEYRILQGQARLDAEDSDGAYAASVSAAELRGGSSKLALGVADFARRMGDDDTAALWVNRALDRDPSNPEALEEAAKLLRELGDAEQADRLVQRAQALRAAENGEP